MAAGDTLLVFTPLHNEPPATANALLDTRNSHPVLDFNDSTNLSAVFTSILPRAYSGEGITAYLHYAMTSAEEGDTDWDGSIERIGESQDIDADGFAAVQSKDNCAVPGTSGLVSIISISFTDGAQMDNLAVGEAFRFKVTRDAVSDTAVGDAELLAIEICESFE